MTQVNYKYFCSSIRMPIRCLSSAVGKPDQSESEGASASDAYYYIDELWNGSPWRNERRVHGKIADYVTSPAII